MMMNGVISTAGVFQYKRLYLHKCYIYILLYYCIFIFLAVFTGQNNTPFLIPPKKIAMILSHRSHLDSVGGFMDPPKEINAFLKLLDMSVAGETLVKSVRHQLSTMS